jgi:cell division protein FtsI (penicillin-binding protein 3)
MQWLAGAALLWCALLLFKLVSIQVVQHDRYTLLARRNQEMEVEVPAPRGTIFDRAGQPLAMSVPTQAAVINPLKVPDVDFAASVLARILSLEAGDLREKLRQARAGRRQYIVIKRKLSSEEAQGLRDLNFDFVSLQTESERRYPGGALAAHVLGEVDFEEKGNAGIERALDPVLRGEPGKVRVQTDAKRRGIEQVLDTEPRPGTPVTLTIDGRVQFVAEREIAAAVIAHHAVSGSIVVMSPRDGQVLALASYPAYDPNAQPARAEDFAARLNHAVGVPFEPGSVFKVITMSAALETTPLRPESLINCHGGVLKLPGRVIHDSHGGTGVIPMAMVLAKSSNIGAIEVGLRVGQEKMYEYMRRFGFGQKTGIELPGESRGRLRTLPAWGKTSLASVSMGQEVSVTTVQLAQAAAAIANGGLLVKPRLVLRKGAQTVPAEQPVRVIRPETAFTMRQMMEGVVLPGGTGTRARLAGYSVGGKTGSAQIFDFHARHYTHTYNGSFVGFAPLSNPAIVVVVTLNGTQGTAGFGGAAAAPVFRALATEALRVMDVPKDLPEELPAKVAGAAGDTDDLALADLGPDQTNILEDGEEDEPAPPGTAPFPLAPGTPTVPNFRGMTLRAVLAEASARGLAVMPDGSGTARGQHPRPGLPAHGGERIRVQFSR